MSDRLDRVQRDPLFEREVSSWDPEWSAADVAMYADNNNRERELWGDLLPAKRVLQRRGFGVWWANQRKRLINVGTQTLSVNQFKQMAALHKRVSGLK
jgi:hypothetical protein